MFKSKTTRLVLITSILTIILITVVILGWRLIATATPTMISNITSQASSTTMDQSISPSALYTQLQQAIKAKDSDLFRKITNETDVTPFTQIANINQKLAQTSIVSTDNNKVVVSQTDCEHQVEFTLSNNSGKLSFIDITSSLQSLCLPSQFERVTIDCKDCKLVPVDKTYALPSSYNPQVVNTELPGEGQVVQETKVALTDMFKAADSQGVDLKIVSAYRSYSKQQTVFEGWVKTEMERGYKRAEAEKRANVYSAYPGHSEHQLGTTVDLSCKDCAAFDNSAGNLKVYKFIEQNAHLYGFVVSYPKDTVHLTGYKYEPWHIRYVGKELATELFNTGYLQGNGNHLAFLLALRFKF